MNEIDWMRCNTLKLFGPSSGQEVHNVEKMHLDIWKDTDEFIDVTLLMEAYSKKDTQIMAILNKLKDE